VTSGNIFFKIHVDITVISEEKIYSGNPNHIGEPHAARGLIILAADLKNMGFLAFWKPAATFSLSYRLAGRRVTHEDNLLKHHCSSLDMLLNQTYYCTQVNTLLKHFLSKIRH
jgi:hypothetical protein